MRNRWHILGAGSIGCLFAAKLHAIGCQTTLVVRGHADHQVPKTHTFSFELHSPSETLQLTLPASYAPDKDPIEHLLITTKAYDAVGALASVAHRLDADSHILLMVNGMGLLENLEDQFPRLKFYVGTTTQGAYRRSRHQIVHAGTGVTKIGRRKTSRPPPWFSDFTELPISCIWENEIESALWQKLAVNCAINPLTALHGCLNGELKTRDDLAEKLSLLCDEIAAIALAADQGILAAHLHQQVNKVVADTAANRSSMLQDVDAQRPTEIDYISGFLIQSANRLGIPAPENEKLLREIHKLESEQLTGRAHE